MIYCDDALGNVFECSALGEPSDGCFLVVVGDFFWLSLLGAKPLCAIAGNTRAGFSRNSANVLRCRCKFQRISVTPWGGLKT